MNAIVCGLLVTTFAAGLLATVRPFSFFRTRWQGLAAAVATITILGQVLPPAPMPNANIAVTAATPPVADLGKPVGWTATVTPTATRNPGRRDEGRLYREKPGDRARYYLLSTQNTASGTVKTLHKRVSTASTITGWTRAEINCRKWLIRDIGYSEEGPDKIESDPSDWYELVPGSSKSDLVAFVCR